MPFRFRCPSCQEVLSSQEDMAGAGITCPLCEARIEVPQPKEPSPATAPASSDTSQQAEVTASEKDVLDLATSASVLPVTFRHEAVERDELDMTPMVDVTFLLLIFFMVTAAFSVQKAFETPAPQDDQPSTQAPQLQDIENDPQYVVVRIDPYNTFHVSAAAWPEEKEVPSKQELLVKLREARATASDGVVPTRMLVMADEACFHERVVMALDAGSAVGMEDVALVNVAQQ